MHKITKGLKKKKKGKKKAKEQELFDEAELERYRREHQEGASGEASAPAKTHTDNEEWSRFNALTQGVDSILKKTQGDLDRIKSTSFFQRKKVIPLICIFVIFFKNICVCVNGQILYVLVKKPIIRKIYVLE